MTLYGAGAFSSAETEELSETKVPSETEAAAVCSSLLFSFVRKRRGPRKASDETDEQSGDDRPFSDPVQAMGEEERKDCRDDRQRHVKSNLCGSEFRFPRGRHSTDERFAGEHRHIGEDFCVYSESQDHAPDQQIDHRRKIGLRMYEKQHDHGQVDKISEQDGDRDLQQMLRLKIPAQDDELDQDQQKAECDRELSQCKRENQAEDIGDR